MLFNMLTIRTLLNLVILGNNEKQLTLNKQFVTVLLTQRQMMELY